jgi:ketosteroid isomerase-like protein
MAQKDGEAVLDILAKYDTAWNKKDSATVGNILAPGYIYFSSTGSITTRERTLEFLNSPKYILTSAQRSEVKTYRTGDTVIVSSRWIGKGTYDKEEIDDQRCGLVFTKIGKQWKLISEHCAQIVSK